VIPPLNPWRARGPLNLAHQGGAAEAPSSTLYAFRSALQAGATALELDVHATADGHLVVVHDDTVDRTTQGTGAVHTLTLAQVRRLDAAYHFTPADWSPGHGPRHPLRGIATGRRPPPEGASPEDFTIPLLAEVLQNFPGVPLSIDIKTTAPQTPPYEHLLAELLAEHGRGEETIVASFADAALAAFAACRPAVSMSAGPERVTEFWSAVQGGAPGIELPGVHALQVPLTFGDVTVVDDPFVAGAHHRDLAVHVWTIDDAETMHGLLDLGVDGIVTDRPSLLHRVLNQRAAD
jgi:glycerophosphoryl diester phosphodiesterase